MHPVIIERVKLACISIWLPSVEHNTGDCFLDLIHLIYDDD